MAAAQQWRADNSLRSDAAWVEGVNRDHPEQPTWAFPVTADEHADLMGRAGPSPELSAKLNAYTERFPKTFAGVWLDQAAHGRITVAFTAEVDARRRELDGLFGPGVPHAVIGATTSLAQLNALNDDFTAWNQDRQVAGGFGPVQDIGVLEIDLYVRDEPSVRAVADRFGDRPICVAGRAPAEIVPEGPQPARGDGWRLLADAPRGQAGAVSVAQDQPAYDHLWATLGLDGVPPAVDFATEIVVHFGPAVSGSCRHVRLDGVIVDAGQELVYPQVVLPGAKQSLCTSDATPYTYLVAMQRSSLPKDFTLQVSKDLPSGATRGRIRVHLSR